jgi:primosomal protein N' (replication factor Y)
LENREFIRVILPQALPALYTYRVPEPLQDQLTPGMRVEVQFGRRKLYAALVHSFCARPDDVRQVKEVLSILDDKPIIAAWQLDFWEWMSGYYLCTLGEVMQAALPAAFKLESASSFIRNPEAEYQANELEDDEFMIAEAFDFQEELSLQDIQDILSRKAVMKVVRSLIDKRILYIREELVERYRPRTVAHVEMTEHYEDEDELRHLLDNLNRAPKQQALVLAYLDQKYRDNVPFPKTQLQQLADAGPAAVRSLVDKDVFRIIDVRTDRLARPESGGEENILEIGQAAALEQLRGHLEDGDVALLHGITSSGKTHVYVDLIKEYTEKGLQVLYLLPEIALTAQLIRRLRRWLGDIGVYHSKFSDAERIEIWNKTASGEYQVVLGARSALFLPFRKVGLVIVDEEHDVSYKQYDPAPRYQARDAAVYMAGMHGAKVVLGSATPSFESFFNARSGKYGYVEMTQRYGGILPPFIEIANLQQARKRKQMHGAFSTELVNAISDVLEKKGQVILFQNRRGYAPYLACGECNWIPQCRNCDVSLTYHKFTEDLRCHYCGYREGLVKSCRSCASFRMELRGMGTERIEDDLKVIFPGANVARMDWDSVRTKYGHDKIIGRLESGEIDILVGTQMVTKGLDFENVKLVGVLNADALLYFPDFRAVERAFQVLMQVSGRSGRKGERGRVIIQMSDVGHPIIRYLLQPDGYEKLYADELMERQAFKYPPYVRLLKIILKHKDYKIVEQGAQAMSKQLRSEWGGRIIGPVKPVVSRVRTLYIREITVKMEKQADVIKGVKDSIVKARNELYQYQEFRSIRIYADVDAY